MLRFSAAPKRPKQKSPGGGNPAWAGMSLPLRGEIQEAQLQNFARGGKGPVARAVVRSRASEARVSDGVFVRQHLPSRSASVITPGTGRQERAVSIEVSDRPFKSFP